MIKDIAEAIAIMSIGISTGLILGFLIIGLIKLIEKRKQNEVRQQIQYRRKWQNRK